MIAALLATLLILSPGMYESRVGDSVNDVRLNKVTYGPCVDKVAERRARLLAEGGTLAHYNLRPVARRCNGVMVGEVLARGAVAPATVRDLWMRSPAHEVVITRESYRRIGVGSVYRDGVWTTVAIFIRH